MDNANAASAVSPTNKSSLASRVLSALVLLPVIALLVWWSIWPVVVAVVAATFIGLLELYSAFTAGGYRPHTALGIGIGLAVVLAVALRLVISYDLLPLVLTLAIMVSLIAALFRRNQEGALPAWALTVAGALYIGWLLSHFIMLRALDKPLLPAPLTPLRIEPGAAWVYLTLAITFLQDTTAYFVGRSLGRHKLAPTLSPKKTWEGAAGGMIGAIVGSLACVLLLGLPISLGAGVVLGVVGGIVGPLGDLAESLIKRQVGLKDAGQIIPGHGGVLDRADSLLFTAPALYYLILLFAGA
ncbi:MAG TPA: phosphatidate cytidylyltransferase [Roseiflexaceae bacterium]|nr:phosphatidate cytidylyltransferase [Roseiflexaceae bacterium]